jgi:hypothetical protein
VVYFAGDICTLFVVNHVCRVLRYGYTCMLVMFCAGVCVNMMVMASVYEAM